MVEKILQFVYVTIFNSKSLWAIIFWYALIAWVICFMCSGDSNKINDDALYFQSTPNLFYQMFPIAVPLLLNVK